MIVQAIGDHSDGENILSAIGAALLLADKVDASKRRRLHIEPIDNWYSNLLQIDDMDINIFGTKIIINFISTEAFAKETFVGGYKKKFN